MSASQVSDSRMEIKADPSGLIEERWYTCSGSWRGWLFQKIAQNLLMDHSAEKLMEPTKRHPAEAPRARRSDGPPNTQPQLGDRRAGWQKTQMSADLNEPWTQWRAFTTAQMMPNRLEMRSLRFCSQRMNVNLVSGQFCWILSTVLFRFRKFGHILLPWMREVALGPIILVAFLKGRPCWHWYCPEYDPVRARCRKLRPCYWRLCLDGWMDGKEDYCTLSCHDEGMKVTAATLWHGRTVRQARADG